MPRREYLTRHVYMTPAGHFHDDRSPRAALDPREVARRVAISNVVQHQTRGEGGRFERELAIAGEMPEAPPEPTAAFWVVKSYYSRSGKGYRFRSEFEAVVQADDTEGAWERFLQVVSERVSDEAVLGSFLKTNRAGIEETAGPESSVTFRVVRDGKVKTYDF